MCVEESPARGKSSEAQPGRKRRLKKKRCRGSKEAIESGRREVVCAEAAEGAEIVSQLSVWLCEAGCVCPSVYSF